MCVRLCRDARTPLFACATQKTVEARLPFQLPFRRKTASFPLGTSSVAQHHHLNHHGEKLHSSATIRKLWFYQDFRAISLYSHAYKFIATVMNKGSDFRVVLLVDNRERNNARGDYTRQSIIDSVNSAFGPGVHCEVSNHLTAGDYLWVARRQGQPDRVLDFIIERKTHADLARTIKTRRKATNGFQAIQVQMRNLINTGINNILLVLEKDGGPTEQCVLTFAEQVEAGVYRTFSAGLERTISQRRGSAHHSETVTTIEFLIEQHARMRRELPFLKNRESYVTLNDLRKKVRNAEACPTFAYYRSLLKIPGIGPEKACAVIKDFPERESIQRHCLSHSWKSLLTIKNIGEKCAQGIHKKFANDSLARAGGGLCSECVLCLPEQLKKKGKQEQLNVYQRRKRGAVDEHPWHQEPGGNNNRPGSWQQQQRQQPLGNERVMDRTPDPALGSDTRSPAMDDFELREALARSTATAKEEERRQQSIQQDQKGAMYHNAAITADNMDNDLQRALAISTRTANEEENRRRLARREQADASMNHSSIQFPAPADNVPTDIEWGQVLARSVQTANEERCRRHGKQEKGLALLTRKKPRRGGKDQVVIDLT